MRLIQLEDREKDERSLESSGSALCVPDIIMVERRTQT